jgi:hypothetical protein
MIEVAHTAGQALTVLFRPWAILEAGDKLLDRLTNTVVMSSVHVDGVEFTV